MILVFRVLSAFVVDGLLFALFAVSLPADRGVDYRRSVRELLRPHHQQQANSRWALLFPNNPVLCKPLEYSFVRETYGDSFPTSVDLQEGF